MTKELFATATLSHYRLGSKIGAGGMGEVFLAQDTKLDRKVAIKFLHAEFSKDADKLGRFIREAKAASALNHPNILTIYEIGEHEGANYIVTELIDGRTLREYLSQRETLKLNQILKIGVQVSEALSAAHQAGIVHRDIKPENIMIRNDGYAKVLDFGLAKLSEPPASVGGQFAIVSEPPLPAGGRPDSEDATKAHVNTVPGMVMGTVSYMSPEQARGNPTDARTDIWSLGVVLYEMLAGKVPFSGETVNHTIVSILEKEPLLLEGVPGQLQRIVRKSLTKDVEMRYQSARDLLIDLKNLRRELDIQGELERSVVPNRDAIEGSIENETQMLTGAGESTVNSGQAATQNLTNSSSSLEYAVTQAKSHKLATTIALGLLVVVLGVAGYFGFVRTSSAKQIESIAVMPFANESGNPDTEYLSDGMTDTLINSLSQIPNLSVKARTSVFFRYKGKEIDVKKVAAELGVNAVLTGRFVQRDDQLSLSVELIDAQTENTIWGNKYERKRSDLVSFQSEVARDVSSKLRSRLSATDAAKVERSYTANAEAYQLYLKGRYFWNKRNEADLLRSIENFNQAIALDPGYAQAYAALADANCVLASYTSEADVRPFYEKARAAARKALEIDPGLAEPHATLASVLYEHDWNFAEAEKEFKRAIEIDPKYPSAHQWYAEYLMTMGRNDESLAEAKIALQLDPYSLIINAIVGLAYKSGRRYDEAIDQYKKTLEMDANFERASSYLAGTYFDAGKFEEGIEQTRKTLAIAGYAPAEIEANCGPLMTAVRKAGGRGYWQKQLDDYSARAQKNKIPIAPTWHAVMQAKLGNNAAALELLETYLATGTHDARFLQLKTSPTWDPVRTEPRFKEMLRKIGFPE